MLSLAQEEIIDLFISVYKTDIVLGFFLLDTGLVAVHYDWDNYHQYEIIEVVECHDFQASVAQEYNKAHKRFINNVKELHPVMREAEEAYGGGLTLSVVFRSENHPAEILQHNLTHFDRIKEANKKEVLSFRRMSRKKRKKKKRACYEAGEQYFNDLVISGRISAIHDWYKTANKEEPLRPYPKGVTYKDILNLGSYFSDEFREFHPAWAKKLKERIRRSW